MENKGVKGSQGTLSTSHGGDHEGHTGTLDGDTSMNRSHRSIQTDTSLYLHSDVDQCGLTDCTCSTQDGTSFGRLVA